MKRKAIQTGIPFATQAERGPKRAELTREDPVYARMQQEVHKKDGYLLENMKHRKEGVELNELEKCYLLPHFFGIVVGKPGSGKTQLVKDMVTHQDLYGRKFDMLCLISPSKGKMGLELPEENMYSEFSLNWIYNRIYEANKIQQKRLGLIIGDKAMEMSAQDGLLMSTKDSGNFGSEMRGLFRGGAMVKSKHIANDMNSSKGNLTGVMIKQFKQARKQEQYSHFKSGAVGSLAQLQSANAAKDTKDPKATLIDEVSKLDSLFMKKLTPEQLAESRFNLLFILDDVISDVKQMELDTYLTQLFFNRRHLIANGVISVFLISQKYTMIPAKIRSNASWLITFKLNPQDFESVFRDAVMLQKKTWFQLLEFVFGREEELFRVNDSLVEETPEKSDKATDGEKDQEVQEEEKKEESVPTKEPQLVSTNKYNNLGIHVELDRYFKNLQPIIIEGTNYCKETYDPSANIQ